METPPESPIESTKPSASTPIAILISFLSDPFSTENKLQFDDSNRKQAGIIGLSGGALLLFLGIAMNGGPIFSHIMLETILLVVIFGAGLMGACAIGNAIGGNSNKDFDNTLLGSGVIYFFSGMGFFAAMIFANMFSGVQSAGFLTMFVLPLLLTGFALGSIASAGVWKRLYHAKAAQATYLAPLLSNMALGIAMFVFVQLFISKIYGGYGGRGMSPFMYNMF